MAGYSGTPLPQKLGIKPNARVALVNAPEDFEDELQPLPEGVALLPGLNGIHDVIVFFSTVRAQLNQEFTTLSSALKPNGGLWIAWPKKASGVTTDLHEQIVRDIGLASGLVDNKVCAVNDTWSGLRFVYRLEDRPKLAK